MSCFFFVRSDRHQQRHHSAPGRQSTLLLVGLHQNDLSDWKFASTEVPKIIVTGFCCVLISPRDLTSETCEWQKKMIVQSLTGRINSSDSSWLFHLISSFFDTVHGWPEEATGENVCSSRSFNWFHHHPVHLLLNDKFENIWQSPFWDMITLLYFT